MPDGNAVFDERRVTEPLTRTVAFPASLTSSGSAGAAQQGSTPADHPGTSGDCGDLVADDASDLVGSDYEDDYDVDDDEEAKEEEEEEEEEDDDDDDAGAASLALTFGMAVAAGLCVNVSFGVLSKRDRGCSHLVTVLQNAFSLCASWRKGSAHWRATGALAVPWPYHACFSACLVAACHLGNVALDLGLPLPLFFLVKCGNLAASMLVGFVVVGKR